MGRRKERRRLAAMSGGSRRVKLDLFAEPAGMLSVQNVDYCFPSGLLCKFHVLEVEEMND